MYAQGVWSTLVLSLLGAPACGPGGRATADAQVADAALHDGALDAPVGLDALLDAPSLDAPPSSCPASLTPGDDGTGPARQALMLSEVNPRNGAADNQYFFELFNNTSATIDLQDGNHHFYSNGASSLVVIHAPGGQVPAGGYRHVGLDTVFTFTDAGGEIALFIDNTNFNDGTKLMDFVCWGTSPQTSVKTLAEAHGKWQPSAPCAPALGMGSIHRKPSTIGTTAADYDVTIPSSQLPTPTCP